jgi:putative ABC transport system substrate-binding protein
MIKDRPQGLLVLDDPIFIPHRAPIVEFAAKHQLPAIYPFSAYTEAGGLMAYSVNLLDLARRAATSVDKILRGAKPSDLPIEQPTTFELVINLRTATALRLTIPQAVLQRADRIIQ